MKTAAFNHGDFLDIHIVIPIAMINWPRAKRSHPIGSSVPTKKCSQYLPLGDFVWI